MTTKIQNIIVISTMLLIPFLILNCTSQKQEDEIYEVRVREALTNNKVSPLSDFVSEDIIYIPLDSKKECLLADNPRFYLNDLYIIAITARQIYLFDRNTGKFVRELGHFGRDPGGYQRTVRALPFYEGRNTFLASGWEQTNYFEYNTEGDIVKEYKNLFPYTSPGILNDSITASYILNFNGQMKDKLFLTNDNSDTIKTYPQYLHYEYDAVKRGVTISESWDGWFYYFDKKLNFYERETDTIFQVKEQSLIPRFVLKNGDYGIPYGRKYEEDYNREDYYFVDALFETNQFLFLQFSFEFDQYFGFYNKENKSLDLYAASRETENIPFEISFVNSKSEIIGYKNAFEILDWFAKNPDLTDKLPENIQKLKTIKETDNPVIMIAKLKE